MTHFAGERKSVHRFYSGPKVEVVRHADQLFWNLAEDTKELLLYPYNSKIPIIFVSKDYVDAQIASVSAENSIFNENLINYIAGNYSVDVDDVFIDMDTQSQNLILTLPAAPEANRKLVITNIGTSGNVVSIMGNGKQVSGLPMQVLPGNFGTYTLRYIGSSWRITDYFPGNNIDYRLSAYNLNGDIDGVNLEFESPIALTSTFMLFQNGLLQKKDADFTLSPDFMVITFEACSVPVPGDIIQVFM